MNEQDREKAFVEKARAALDQSVQELDPRILSRLREARQRALEPGKKRAPRAWHWFPLPAAGLATALVAAVVALFLFGRPPGLEPSREMGDIEILASGDGLDLYADLDFYTWLSEEVEHAG